ncbi:hypothetical protein K1T73_14875 [Roseovarius sp. SCSIO 43702]|uniref:hypothetical protein n=1 Tax=Roseovarius sp. SCSIO 43702 TaxID=2823043 RepID=UPI001C73210C|nr:hypothetical protein [Roseovarius sp. SCSIO 43702]QYX56322.1 hypothetical protein K1T73_14875 [Roseovarius sp. SCSIO 43702]
MSQVANKTATLLLAALIALPTVPGGAAAQDARASLAAALDFFDPVTRRSIRPEANIPFGVRVSLTDVTTGRAPRGLTLAGWVRPKAAGNSSCEAAAQAFRVTSQPPLGSFDLNGILVVTMNEDASIGVIDPKLNLRSSNMIAAANLDRLPSAMAVDPRRFSAHFVTSGQTGLASVSLLTGETDRRFEDMPALSDVAASAESGTWVGRMDGVIFPLDAPHGLRPVGEGPVSLRTAAEPESPLLAAFTSMGGLLVFDGATGTTLLDLPRMTPLTDVALLAEGSVIALPEGGDLARIIYRDAPDRPVDIRLGFGARRIVASPSGRHAIAYAPGGPAAVIIDVARAAVVQPLQLTDGVLSDVAFTDDAAYLLSLDGGFAGLIDLASVAPGRAAQIRKIDLARKSDRPHAGAGLLVPLWPSPQVIAVSPETQTGWLLHDDQAVGEMPPMDSLRLRGGVPARVAVIDRSLRETEPGAFETVTSLPGGQQELVLTTGIGGMTACLDFRVRGPSATTSVDLITLDLETGGAHVVPGKDVELSLTFRDRSGDVIRVEHAEFLVASLSSSWMGRMIARRVPDGSLKGQVRFPHQGPYALHPVALPEDLQLKSAILIEVPS